MLNLEQIYMGVYQIRGSRKLSLTCVAEVCLCVLGVMSCLLTEEARLQKRINSRINRELQRDYKEAKKEIKLLLLGKKWAVGRLWYCKEAR